MATANLNADMVGKPFAEAVAYLADKANVTTEAWWQMWAAEHNNAFTVAGAMRDDMLADFKKAVDAAIADGETLEQFRARFDDIVARYGWSYNGSRGWRSKLIYNTNIQTSYQAGRYQQLEAIKSIAPYWEYRTKEDGRVRPEHQAWDGIVLPADDKWWKTHYPPNGWGCRCRVWPRTKADLGKRGMKGPDKAPNDGTYEWLNKATGEIKEIPVGIDPGWDYNVGEAKSAKNAI